MTQFPNYQAYVERVKQAKLKGDEEAMAKAFEEYAREVRRTNQVYESTKSQMIEEARNHLYAMFKALDAEQEQGTSS